MTTNPSPRPDAAGTCSVAAPGHGRPALLVRTGVRAGGNWGDNHAQTVLGHRVATS